jgi:hypothetical protein
MSWKSRLLSLILLLLAGYAAYRALIYRPITFDPGKLWDFSFSYLPLPSVLAAATFVALLAAGCILCRKYLRNDWLILLVPTAMIICAGQAGALVGFLTQSVAGLAIGMPIYRRLRGGRMPSEISLTGLLLSWFLGGSVNAYAVWIALHWKINFSYIYFGVALLEIGLCRRSLAKAFAFVSKDIKQVRFSPGQWGILLWTIFILPYALVPSYIFDDVWRHVFFPKQVFLFGQHFFDPGNLWSVDTEVFSQSYFTIGYLLGGEIALRFLNLAAVVVGMLLIENFCYRTFGAGPAFFTALALVSLPLFGFTMTCAFIEPLNFLSVTSTMVVAMDGLKRLDRNAIIFPFILAAVAFLYKQQAVFLTLPLAAILTVAIIMLCFRKKTYRPLAWLAGGVLAAIIVVSPFLGQNYILTKNPFFPFLNGVFRSDLWKPVNFEGIRFDHVFSWNILAVLTFHGERFWEFNSLPLGVNFFVLAWFIPFIFISRYKRALKLCLFVLFAASVLLWWIITSPNMRYFVGPFSAGSILLGLTLNMLWENIRRNRLSFSLGAAALAIAVATNAISLLNTISTPLPYPLLEAFTRKYDGLFRLAYLEETRKVFLAANAEYGKDASCLLVSIPYLSFADQHIEWLGWSYIRNWKATKIWRNEEDAFDWIFRERKFDCMIINQDYNKFPLLMSTRFRNLVNVDFAHEKWLLLSPKAGNPNGVTGR